MRTRHTTALAATLLLGLTACGSDTDDKPAAQPSAPAPTTSSAFLRPTPEQEKTLIAALTAIDPNLTVKEERAISRSVGVCDDIRKGKDQATVVKNAAYRYNGGTASADETKGAQIVEAIKTAYCKN
ncbi:hypothetical protein ACFUGD_01830 [Streptomyces sp. NPDC057217]|uniref:hypothetical protein n=1 Tax=Streptomyces sp. NPDC057217 TaxID=3346054 RepID=UPI00363042FF